MSEIALWVEWRVDEGAAAQFEQLLREIIRCVHDEEPGATSFWAYRGSDGRSYHRLEVFRDIEAAELHLRGDAGPVRAYVPRQREIASLTRIEIHGDVRPEEAARLTAHLGGALYIAVAGFSRFGEVAPGAGAQPAPEPWEGDPIVADRVSEDLPRLVFFPGWPNEP